MTDFSNATNPLTSAAAASADASGAPPVINKHALFTRVYNLEQSVATLEAQTQNEATVYNRVAFADQPSATDFITIASEKFEFVATDGAVANDANIAVEIGDDLDETIANLVAAINAQVSGGEHPNITKADTTTPALANGTKHVVAEADLDNDYVYIFPADGPGGTVVSGTAPNVAFTKQGSDITLLRTNFNVLPAVTQFDNAMMFRVDVTTALLALTQPLTFVVPFEPQGVLVQARGSNGDLLDAYVPATWSQLGTDDWQVELNINDQTPTRVETVALELAVGATENTSPVWWPRKAVLVTEVALTHDATGASNGTLALDFSLDRLDAAGTPTAIASAVDVKALTADTKAAVTLDDVPAPFAVAATEGLKASIDGDADITAPTKTTVTISYVEVLANTDDLFVVVFG